MFQILHFADLHLDTAFIADGLPPTVGAWRRDDLRATLGRILTLARERRVDAVTIAGDLYDQAYALPDLADFLKQQFTRLAPIRVFITPGQHDPYTNDSLYTLTEWPENVTVFSQARLSAVELAPGIHLWGAAHPPRKEARTLTGFRANQPGVNLLLLHATTTEQTGEPTLVSRVMSWSKTRVLSSFSLSPEDDNSMFAVDASAIQAAGFGFALLGSQHHGRLWPDDAPCCVYPGSPELLSMAEAAGSHQAVLLTIEDNRCTPAELIPLSQWHYQSIEVDVTGCRSSDEVTQRIKRTLPTTADDKRSMAYITLVGVPDFMLNVATLSEVIATRAFLHYEIRLSLNYDLEQLSQELTVRGLLVRRFQARLNQVGTDQERYDLLNALHLALQALDGKQIPLSYEVVE